MLSAVTADAPSSAPAFYDVPRDAWYAPAVQKAAGLGLMSGTDGAFRPSDSATRAECAAALALLLPYDAWSGMQAFPDVPTGHWAYLPIVRTAAYGLFRGDGAGLFHPGDGLKRCEATAVFNRLLGRTPDTAYLSHHTGLPSFPDVPATHWAYADVMEAAVTHQCSNWLGREIWISADAPALVQPALPEEPTLPTASSTPEPAQTPSSAQSSVSALPDGPQRIDGRLYWYVNGEPVRSQSVSGLYFDENGCYTTGNAELDEKLNAIVEELTDDSMTRDQKLRVLFNYVWDNFKYLKRPLISKGQTGWEPEYALFFLNNGKGNCYSFSAAYCLLCRELGLPLPGLTLPIGISFFTFQGLSYALDVHRDPDAGAKSLGKLMLYISFFPQLIAGPIIKYHDVARQIDSRELTPKLTLTGLRRFIVGFAKKLLANTAGRAADAVFALTAGELDMRLAWLGAVCFTLQIYFDFSGYSDMAIGLGRMFGFSFQENFNLPYVSKSVKEFWRRWHISLSSWFRDYLYIPLGGNRKGRVRTMWNKFVVFFSTGLWHGANWTFMLWGLWHGLFATLEDANVIPKRFRGSSFSHLYTMLVVILGFTLFRADSLPAAGVMFTQMFAGLDFTPAHTLTLISLLDRRTVFFLLAAVLLALGLPQRLTARLSKPVPEAARQWARAAACAALFAVCVLNLSSTSFNPFIYFQF